MSTADRIPVLHPSSATSLNCSGRQGIDRRSLRINNQSHVQSKVAKHSHSLAAYRIPTRSIPPIQNHHKLSEGSTIMHTTP